MVAKKKRRRGQIEEKDIKQDILRVDVNPFQKSPVGQEKIRVPFYKDGYSEKEVEREKKGLIKSYEERGYKLIESLFDSDKIFKGLTIKQRQHIGTGRLFCFVWKYSGWLDLLVSVEEKEKYIDSLDRNSQLAAMDIISEHKAISMTYLIDEEGFPQITNESARMKQRDEDGKFLYGNNGKMGQAKKSHPIWRAAEIYDAPLEMIKKAVELAGLKLSTAKNKKA